MRFYKMTQIKALNVLGRVVQVAEGIIDADLSEEERAQLLSAGWELVEEPAEPVEPAPEPVKRRRGRPRKKPAEGKMDK
jgi:hypothetical protein